jgi:uncharacterized repeat protein (TIGR02543 family)
MTSHTDIILYAIWAPDPGGMARLFFVLSGGNGGPNSITETGGSISQTCPEGNPTRSGYSFMCWKDIRGNVYYGGVTNVTVDIGKNLILYAHWLKN